MLREFTEAEKEKLLKYIDDDNAKNNNRCIFGGIIDFFADGINYYDLDISEYLDDLDTYHKKLVDKEDMAKSDIIKLFDDVDAVDKDYEGKLAEKLDMLKTYSNTLKRLTNIIDVKSSFNGKTSVFLSTVSFQSSLSKTDSELMDKYIEKFVIKDKDGNSEFKWDQINETLNKKTEDITEMEYLVLASLYLTMDTEDTGKFLQALADKISDVKIPWYQQIFHQYSNAKYTTWKYDSDKMAGLQKYLLCSANSLAEQERIIEGLSSEKLKNEFERRYPKIDVDYLDFDLQKMKLVTDIDEQRLEILQKNSLLTVCSELSQSDSASESGIRLFSSWYEYGDLTGEAGAFGPKLKLINEKDGYSLTFCNSKITDYHTMDNQDLYNYENTDFNIRNTYINTLNENTISISEVYSGAKLTEAVNENAKIYYDMKYSYSSQDAVTGNVSDFVVDQVTDKTIEYISAGASWVPIVGDFVSLGMDIAIDIEKGKAEAKANQTDAKNTYNAIENTLFCDAFALNGVVVTSGKSSQQIISYPSAETANRVENLNLFIKSNQIDLSKYNLTYPITIEDLDNKLSEINNLIFDNEVINSSEFDYIFDSKH